MRSLSGSTYLSALNWKPWETNFKGQIEKTLQMRLNGKFSKWQCRPKAHAVYIQQETIDCIPARIHPAHPAAHALTAAKCNIHKSKSYSAINAFCVAFVSQLFGCVCFMQQSTILTPFHAVGSTQPTLAASIKNFDCHCFCLHPVTWVPCHRRRRRCNRHCLCGGHWYAALRLPSYRVCSFSFSCMRASTSTRSMLVVAVCSCSCTILLPLCGHKILESPRSPSVSAGSRSRPHTALY